MRPAASGGWRAILYRCFVEYNPLYFASSMCILAGVFLLAHALPREAWGSKFGIVSSTEAYQFLLLAAAAILLRAGLKRPAAILGLTALVFLLDAALNSERLLSHVGLISLAPGMRARRAIPTSIALAVLGPIKLALLAVVFRLRGARAPLAVTGVVLLALPLVPYLTEIVHPTRRETVYLLSTWLGAPLLCWAFSPSARRWTSAWLADPREPRFRRIAALAPFLVASMFSVHGLVWSVISSLTLTPAHAAPFLLALTAIAALRLSSVGSGKAELVAWVGSGATLWAAACASVPGDLWPLAVMSIAAGGLLVFLIEAEGLRLFLPAAVCVFGGTFVLASGAAAPLPGPGILWPVGLATALLAGAVRQRDFRCLFVSAIAAGAAVASIDPTPALAGYGAMVAGLWLAAASWLFFPEFRRVPFAATVWTLAVGAGMVRFDVPGIDLGYGAVALGTLGIGVLIRRVEFQAAGVSSGAVLAAFHHGAWVPATALGWGILLLSAGFVLLSAGVAVNLLLARGRPPLEGR
ncbi:MAG TPA: hypothetical protein VNM14_11500 [Planctomycetota bacterium]|nr:hypothetical protein [Planctomycetota bacterium]